MQYYFFVNLVEGLRSDLVKYNDINVYKVKEELDRVLVERLFKCLFCHFWPRLPPPNCYILAFVVER